MFLVSLNLVFPFFSRFPLNHLRSCTGRLYCLALSSLVTHPCHVVISLHHFRVRPSPIPRAAISSPSPAGASTNARRSSLKSRWCQPHRRSPSTSPRARALISLLRQRVGMKFQEESQQVRRRSARPRRFVAPQCSSASLCCTATTFPPSSLFFLLFLSLHFLWLMLLQLQNAAKAFASQK
jgi:hypothetical protein